ncbi:hypothetical protein MFRU_005g01370 [Monilinia fructicola]|uniref:Uncharacterized protein n=1 Tax=Monilinia fructicola TaxID=38448 RepID=A0A5M9JMU0_MONFR|nr:hypothetical protein EYC84_002318 [Monilinia fructicola]KAG4033120.1 hypothetical protein MFRU_005g01370 [Monilinia fructicola]
MGRRFSSQRDGKRMDLHTEKIIKVQNFLNLGPRGYRSPSYTKNIDPYQPIIDHHGGMMMQRPKSRFRLRYFEPRLLGGGCGCNRLDCSLADLFPCFGGAIRWSEEEQCSCCSSRGLLP